MFKMFGFVCCWILIYVIQAQDNANTEDYLIFAEQEKGSIKSRKIGDSNITDIHPEGTFNYIRGMAFDRSNSVIFIVDDGRDQIWVSHLDEQKTTYSITDLPQGCWYGVAIDTIRHQFYVSDACAKLIYRININGSNPEKWVSASIAYGLTIDAVEGYLYWPESSNFRIMRAPIDNPAGKMVIASGMRFPFGIYAYLERRQIYWTEHNTGKVEESSLNGDNRRVLVHILQSGSTVWLNYITGMDDHLYIPSHEEIYDIDIDKSTYTILPVRGTIHAYSIVAVSLARDDITPFMINEPTSTSTDDDVTPETTTEINTTTHSSTFISTEDSGTDTTWELTTLSSSTALTVQVKPVVYSAWPNYGPQTGGTVMTVHGQNFPLDNSVNIYVGHKLCDHVSQNSTLILCRTVQLDDTDAHLLQKELPISISHTDITTNVVFMYKENPIINSVYPKESIIRGGTRLTVNGENLDSVALIFMETTMVLVKSPGIHEMSTLFQTVCDVQTRNRMLCLTPNITLPGVFMRRKSKGRSTRGTSNIDAYSKRTTSIHVSENGDYTLEFYIGFKLDGVKDYRNHSKIDIYSEPVFDQIAVTRPFVKEQRLEFKGKHLDSGITVHDYTIIIGVEICGNIDLLPNILSCYPPQIKPGNDTDTNTGDPLITIHIGQNVDHFAGYLHYQQRIPLYIVIPAIVVPAAFITLVVAVTVECIKMRRPKGRRKQDKTASELNGMELSG